MEAVEAAMPAAQAADARAPTAIAGRRAMDAVPPVAIAPGLLLTVESLPGFAAAAKVGLVPSAAAVLLPRTIGAAPVGTAVPAGESVIGPHRCPALQIVALLRCHPAGLPVVVARGIGPDLVGIPVVVGVDGEIGRAHV